MIYSKLIIKFKRTLAITGKLDRRQEDEWEYKIVATGNGLMIEMPNDFYKFHTDDREIMETLTHDAQMFLWDEISWELYAIGSKPDDEISIYKETFGLEQCVALRKLAEAQDKKIAEMTGENVEEWDGTYDWCREICVRWVISTFIDPLVDKLKFSIKKHKLIEEIEGKECPVLMVPLKMNDAAKFNMCGHYISRSAYQQIKPVAGQTQCPMCRCEHHVSMMTLI